MTERNNFEIGKAGEAAVDLLEKTLGKAEERGHKNATIGSGAGAGIGGILGSFGGPLGAAGGVALGGLLGNLIGSIKDEDS